MTFRHLETLPHSGLPEWQHHQFRADICRFHTLGGVLDFQQFAYTTAADGEAERCEYHLQTANHTLQAVIAECNEQAAERAAEHRLPAPPPLTRFFSLQADMGRKISAERFYGNQLDLRYNRLIIRGQGSQFGRFLYHDNETDADRAIAPNALDTAFCHAFLNPPYPPRFGHSARETGNTSLTSAVGCSAIPPILKHTNGIPIAPTTLTTAANGGAHTFGPYTARKTASTPASWVPPPIKQPPRIRRH